MTSLDDKATSQVPQNQLIPFFGTSVNKLVVPLHDVRGLPPFFFLFRVSVAALMRNFYLTLGIISVYNWIRRHYKVFVRDCFSVYQCILFYRPLSGSLYRRKSVGIFLLQSQIFY